MGHYGTIRASESWSNESNGFIVVSHCWEGVVVLSSMPQGGAGTMADGVTG